MRVSSSFLPGALERWRVAETLCTSSASVAVLPISLEISSVVSLTLQVLMVIFISSLGVDNSFFLVLLSRIPITILSLMRLSSRVPKLHVLAGARRTAL